MKKTSMSVSEALGDIFGNFEGQDEAESVAHFPPIISSEPICRPPSPSSSMTAQPPPCTDYPKALLKLLPTSGELPSC